MPPTLTTKPIPKRKMRKERKERGFIKKNSLKFNFPIEFKSKTSKTFAEMLFFSS